MKRSFEVQMTSKLVTDVIFGTKDVSDIFLYLAFLMYFVYIFLFYKNAFRTK